MFFHMKNTANSHQYAFFIRQVLFWLLKAKLESAPALPSFGARKQLIFPLKMFHWSLKSGRKPASTDLFQTILISF